MSDARPMDELTVLDSLSAFNGVSRKVVFRTEAQNRPLPVPAYDGQSDPAFEQGMSLYNAQVNMALNAVHMAGTDLFLFTIENARFVMYPGLDGMIIDSNNNAIVEPSCFCHHGLYQGPKHLPEMPIHEDLDEVFLGFDVGWGNYYHWMLYGVSKTQLAGQILSPDVKLVVPDIARVVKNRHPAFAPETFEASLRLAGLQDRSFRASDGVYRARKLHFFWHAPTMPDLPTRFYVSREGGHNSRITPEEQVQIDLVLARQKFKKSLSGEDGS